MNAHNQGSDLQALRGELRRQLALQQKNSLYSVLGLPADCSDAAIAEAIARLNAGGAAPDAEARYAIEILGRPESREAFDRQLADLLRKPIPMPLPMISQPAAASAGRSPWLLPVTIGVIGLLLLGIGWLGYSSLRDSAERELRAREAEARAEDTRRRAEIAARQAETQRRAVEASIAAQQRDADAQDKAGEEARLREERFREEREKNYQQQLAREANWRQEAEKAATNQAARDMLNSMTSQAARGARER